MADARKFTARSLLHKFLDLRGYTPELADWTEERLSGNPPRLYRLRQLVALFRAFDLPWDPESFMKGEFIEYKHPRYAALLEKLAQKVPEDFRDGVRAHQLPHFFETLFDYRTRVDEVLLFGSGGLATRGLGHHADQITDEVTKVIRDQIATVEDTLAALISPEGASFSIEQLVRDYEYPDVDLFWIGLAWV